MAKKILVLIYILINSSLFYAEDISKEDQEKLTKVYAMYDEFKDEFKSVTAITPKELKQLKAKYTIVDVRDKEEQDISMIPAAITKEEFEKNKDKYKDTIVITYCTIGYRSGYYAEKLSKEGFKAQNLKGSILAWVLSGESVQKDGKDVFEVHVYGKKWNILPSKYKSIW